MAVPVIMPKLEMSQETGTLIEWLAKEGDHIEKGQPLLEVETDKITMEIEAPASGVLAEIGIHPGDVVPVTTVIAQILEPDEWARRQTGAVPAPTVSSTPVAQRLADGLGIDLSKVKGTGPGGRITRADVEAVASPSRPLAASLSGQEEEERGEPRGAVRATPAARRVAREVGLELRGVTGTGPRGRIQAADVRQAMTVLTSSPLAGVTAGAEPVAPPILVPLTGMRATIAHRMTQSYQSAPHIHLTLSVDVTEAEATRQRWGELSSEKISLTVLLVKTCAWALRRHPHVNATIDNDGVSLWQEINVGVAVALLEGLIVPVLRRADIRPAGELARELRDLAERARKGELQAHEVTGGTFTLTNLGMYGIEDFDPILNPPQVAILGVGAVVPTVVPLGNEIVIRPRMQLTLAVDHRALDGVMAAQFLQDVCQAIEQPALMLL